MSITFKSIALLMASCGTLLGSSVSLAASAPQIRVEQTLVNDADYSAEELRNIQTLLAVLAQPDGLETTQRAEHFCKAFKAIGARPYDVLDKMYGRPDGFRRASLQDQVRTVQRLLAKGNEAWFEARINAIHAGPLYGVAGTGKPLTLYERGFVRFDDQGRICESTLVAQQGELYRQLGGQFIFPKESWWYCPKCMEGPAQLLPPPASAQP